MVSLQKKKKKNLFPIPIHYPDPENSKAQGKVDTHDEGSE